MALADDLVRAMDPAAFARRSLGLVLDDWQARALRSTAPRMLWNVTRQGGKSTVAAALAVHRAIFYPASLILLLSPSLRQSGELFKKCSEHLNRLQQRPQMVEDNRLSAQLVNGSRIVSLPATEATIRGFSGVALLIEDEASRVADLTHHATRPMLAVSGGRQLLLSTPFGRRGHFYEEWTAGGPEWERVKVPAVECPRIPADFLETERRSMPRWFYVQEYECEFSDTDDQLFGTEFIEAAADPDLEIVPL